MSDKRKKIVFISFVQIIAMVFIVLSHSVPDRQSTPTALTALIPYFQHIGLTIFMWASGYLLIKTDSISKYGYWKYLKRRFVRLMVPFFVIQLIMLVPKYLMSSYTHREVDISPMSVIRSFLYPREGILPHLWFLPILMFFIIIAPLLIKLVKNKYACLSVMAIAFILAILSEFTNLLCINDLKNYLFWFVLGLSSANYIHENILNNRTHLLICTMISGGGYVLLVTLTNMNNYLWIVASILSLTFFIALSLLLGDSPEKLCNVVGAYTFPIYILSLPIQNIIEIVLVKINMPWFVTFSGMFICGAVIPLTIAVIVSRIDKNRKYKVLSRCIGL